MADRVLAAGWLGTRFEIDMAKNTLRIGTYDGWYDPIEIDDVKSNNRFTAYIAYSIKRTVKDEIYRLRFSYRVYEDGRARAEMSQPRYVTLTGHGEC
ncbi:MAG: hypothetical protein AAGJ34_13045 [Pseudomonadota bacterium]